MATLAYPSLTSRQPQQSTQSGSLITVSQSNQLQSNSPRTQVASNQQLGSSQSNNGRLGRSPSSRLPNQQSSQPSTPGNPLPPRKESPGAWKHPRAEEIARRQRSSTFGPDNISTIFKTSGLLIVVQILRWGLPTLLWKMLQPVTQVTGDIVLYLLYALATYNLFFALKPLYTGPDQLLDIDLNATQRSLLGLDPNATPPATPTTKYSTPPRYTRSASRNGTPASRGSSPAASPLAYKDNPFRRSSGSFSSSRRASFGSDTRRQSFGISSNFGTPFKDSVFAPQTPSPITKASGITFSNKWLYHKGTSAAFSRDSL